MNVKLIFGIGLVLLFFVLIILIRLNTTKNAVNKIETPNDTAGSNAPSPSPSPAPSGGVSSAPFTPTQA